VRCQQPAAADQPVTNDRPEDFATRQFQFCRQQIDGLVCVSVERQTLYISEPKGGPTEQDLQVGPRSIGDVVGGLLQFVRECGARYVRRVLSR
jgi:hypothetical protein